MEKSTYLGLSIFILIIFGGLFLNLDLFNNKKYFSIDAKWFEFNPNEIRVKKGDIVTIEVNNLDVTHGVIIPELEISGDEIITFNAYKKGEYFFYCNNFCGVDHSEMIGKIIIE